MSANSADDEAEAGSRPPGQRAATRRATPSRPSSRRAAGADLPDTPNTELPAVIPETPVSAQPTISTTYPAATPEPAAVDSPTTELRDLPRIERPLNPLPSNVYRSRRPGVAILLVIPAVAVGVLLVRTLAIATFRTSDLGGTIGSICGLASLPFLVAGIYGLVTGAAHGAEHHGFRVWARPPLAYLIVGLTFVVATAIAID